MSDDQPDPAGPALTLTLSSQLAASCEELWRHVSSMAGVNAELHPLSMSYPPAVAALSVADAPLGQVLFRSWVRLWGVLVLDRHALRLTEITPGAGFHEESTSWLQRRWVHDRRICAVPGGCLVTDRLTYEPRLRLLRPIVQRVVRLVFARRHRYLRRRFHGQDARGPQAFE